MQSIDINNKVIISKISQICDNITNLWDLDDSDIDFPTKGIIRYDITKLLDSELELKLEFKYDDSYNSANYQCILKDSKFSVYVSFPMTLECAIKFLPLTISEYLNKHMKKDIEFIDSKLSEYTNSADIFPRWHNWFRAFFLTDITRVKVVILGQDPYHTYSKHKQPIASGLSFSSWKNEIIPPSLKNIFTEIETNFPEQKFNFTHPDLTKWAEQGVLMINSALTVMKESPGSHVRFYAGFMTCILNLINEKNRGVIYLLWGEKAKFYKPYIPKKQIILESSHPSPLGCRKGFFGCGHFSKINEILKSRGSKEIDWQN